MEKSENVIRVNSYAEFLNAIFYDTWNEQLGRYRSQYAYRGLSDSTHQLESTLIRLGGEFKNLEKHLLRNFKKYAYGNFVQKDSIWHWLSLAQHHGLPTRLLDWTFSPLVAMHFATTNIETSSNDGIIWAVNYVKAHDLLPEKVRIELKKEGSDLFTADMLAELFETLHEFDELYKDDFLIFFEPPSLDDRIVNQYALFSVFSDSGVPLDNWLEKHPEIWRKIIIPYELKWEIRDKLDQSNITERVLFPGLDGLSRWLKRHYSPKNDMK